VDSAPLYVGISTQTTSLYRRSHGMTQMVNKLLKCPASLKSVENTRFGRTSIQNRFHINHHKLITFFLLSSSKQRILSKSDNNFPVIPLKDRQGRGQEQSHCLHCPSSRTAQNRQRLETSFHTITLSSSTSLPPIGLIHSLQTTMSLFYLQISHICLNYLLSHSETDKHTRHCIPCWR